MHQLLSISMDTGNTLLCNSTAVPVFNIKPRFFHLFLFHSYWTEIITSFTYECIQSFFPPPSCKPLLIRISFCGFCNKISSKCYHWRQWKGGGGVEKVLLYVDLCKYVSVKNAVRMRALLGLTSDRLGIVLTSDVLYGGFQMTVYEMLRKFSPTFYFLRNPLPSFMGTQLYFYSSPISNWVPLL